MKLKKTDETKGRAWRQALLELIRKTTEMEKRLDRILDDDRGQTEEESEEKLHRGDQG